MPTLRNPQTRGDHYITLIVDIPTKLNNEQKEALMKAVSAALKSMSSDAQDYIKSNFGDTTQYLENRIEAQIDANHVAAKQAAAQNTLNLG